MVAQQAGFARDFVERNARVWATAEHSLGAKAADLGPDQVTPDRVEAVRRLAADLRVVAAEAARRADEAEAVHRRLADAIGRRDRAAKPVDTLVAPSDTAPILVDGGPAVALPPFPTLPVVPPADAGSTPVGVERSPSGTDVELPARDDAVGADATTDRSVAM